MSLRDIDEQTRDQVVADLKAAEPSLERKWGVEFLDFYLEVVEASLAHEKAQMTMKEMRARAKAQSDEQEQRAFRERLLTFYPAGFSAFLKENLKFVPRAPDEGILAVYGVGASRYGNIKRAIVVTNTRFVFLDIHAWGANRAQEDIVVLEPGESVVQRLSTTDRDARFLWLTNRRLMAVHVEPDGKVAHTEIPLLADESVEDHVDSRFAGVFIITNLRLIHLKHRLNLSGLGDNFIVSEVAWAEGPRVEVLQGKKKHFGLGAAHDELVITSRRGELRFKDWDLWRKAAAANKEPVATLSLYDLLSQRCRT